MTENLKEEMKGKDAIIVEACRLLGLTVDILPVIDLKTSSQTLQLWGLLQKQYSKTSGIKKLFNALEWAPLCIPSQYIVGRRFDEHWEDIIVSKPLDRSEALWEMLQAWSSSWENHKYGLPGVWWINEPVCYRFMPRIFYRLVGHILIQFYKMIS